MKKKKLIKEIERLNKRLSDQRAEIEVLLSEGIEFDKLMIKTKYVVETDFEQVMWQGESSNLGTINGLILTEA